MSATELLIILALTGYAVYKQTRVHEVTANGRFKLAIIYVIVGICLGIHMSYSPATLGLLVLSLAASLLVGYVRGQHSQMWADATGRVFTRGTPFTVGLFLALIVFKFALGTFAYFAHIADNSGMGEILLMIGLMVAVQAEMTYRRAQNFGTRTIAPSAPTATVR
jgi:hypothetical protein